MITCNVFKCLADRKGKQVNAGFRIPIQQHNAICDIYGDISYALRFSELSYKGLKYIFTFIYMLTGIPDNPSK